MPEIRNKHNAYSVSTNADEMGIGIISQRDPEVVNTFYTYSKLGDMINDTALVSDVPAQIIDGRTMVPVRTISESLGCLVRWDGGNQLVTVIK